MSFSTGSLTAYIEQNAEKIIAAQITEPKTAGMIAQGGTIMSGVKSKERITVLETDAVFQALTGCGFNASGTTTISQREISVGGIKIEEAMCPRDLEAYYTQKMLTAGAHYDGTSDFNFYQWWVNRKVALTGVALETAIWQGDTASGNANLNKFDGLKKLIVAASDEIDANVSGFYGTPLTVAGGGITQANVMNVLDAIFKATPVEILDKDDYRVFVGHDVLRLAKLAVRGSNYFHYTADAPDTLTVPGTNVQVVAVNGLNSTQDLFGIRLSNLYIGTDLESDVTGVKAWYSQDDDNVKFSMKFKYGVQFGFGSEIVKFVVD